MHCAHCCALHAGWIKADSDEKSVMAAVAKGPLAVGIEADQMAFQFYRDGVFSSPCGTDLDHGVVLVGYGTDEETDLPYWKVKNSWGATWGELLSLLLLLLLTQQVVAATAATAVTSIK
jgi:C1A family cysteine protease